MNLMPEEKGVEGLARQIKLTGRAYPIFDIAHLILKKPDRFTISFAVIKIVRVTFNSFPFSA